MERFAHDWLIFKQQLSETLLGLKTDIPHEDLVDIFYTVRTLIENAIKLFLESSIIKGKVNINKHYA